MLHGRLYRALIGCACVFVGTQTVAAATDTAFTYQGLLSDNGAPVSGMVDLEVALFDADAGGTQIGSTIALMDVPVGDGIFSIEVDFGGEAFNGERWLELSVNGMTLSPRQAVTSAPYAIQTRGLFVDDMGNVAVGHDMPVAHLDARNDHAVQSAIRGQNDSTTGVARGVWGLSASDAGVAIEGTSSGSAGFTAGVLGTAASPDGKGVEGRNSAPTGPAYGVYGETGSTAGYGVYGMSTSMTGTTYGVYGEVPGGSAGFGVFANGKIGASGFKTFRIDHPLDPAHLYLQHYSSEAPEPINEYSGNVILDAAGTAWVQLPNYFESINTDFRYVLTPIGAPATLYVAQEIENNRFRVAGGTPGMKVSWEVKARRNDPYARAYHAPVVIEKQGREVGRYLQPSLYGQPASKGMGPVVDPSQTRN